LIRDWLLDNADSSISVDNGYRVSNWIFSSVNSPNINSDSRPSIFFLRGDNSDAHRNQVYCPRRQYRSLLQELRVFLQIVYGRSLSFRVMREDEDQPIHLAMYELLRSGDRPTVHAASRILLAKKKSPLEREFLARSKS